jgi:hypothetical protein
MVQPNLASVRAKMARAQSHLDELFTVIDSLGRPGANVFEYVVGELANDEFVIRVGEILMPEPGLGPIIGDCVHNLRSALDHLVLQLAVLNSLGKDAEQKTSFPVCLNARDFLNATDKYVKPFVSSDALAAIEEMQPYRTLEEGATTGERSFLWFLSQLDNIDKHRVILVAGHQIAVAETTVQSVAGPIILQENWVPMEKGQILARFRNPIGMKANLHFTLKLVFKETGLLCDGEIVQETLLGCLRVVEFIVDEFEKKFFKPQSVLPT